jgi:hypothetical protein
MLELNCGRSFFFFSGEPLAGAERYWKLMGKPRAKEA